MALFLRPRGALRFFAFGDAAAWSLSPDGARSVSSGAKAVARSACVPGSEEVLADAFEGAISRDMEEHSGIQDTVQDQETFLLQVGGNQEETKFLLSAQLGT